MCVRECVCVCVRVCVRMRAFVRMCWKGWRKLTNRHINATNALMRVIDERIRKHKNPENGDAAPNALIGKNCKKKLVDKRQSTQTQPRAL